VYVRRLGDAMLVLIGRIARKAEFAEITSIHIYSLEPGPIEVCGKPIPGCCANHHRT
jgi:hypothetical protein